MQNHPAVAWLQFEVVGERKPCWLRVGFSAPLHSGIVRAIDSVVRRFQRDRPCEVSAIVIEGEGLEKPDVRSALSASRLAPIIAVRSDSCCQEPSHLLTRPGLPHFEILPSKHRAARRSGCLSVRPIAEEETVAA